MLNDQKIIVFNSIVFGLVGSAFLVFPQTLAEFTTGSAPSSPSGLMDMRAVYGGVVLGFGAVLYLLGRSPETRRQGLLALIAVLGGMAIGRVIGFFVDGPGNFFMYTFLAYEVLFILLCVLALGRKPTV